MTTRVEARVEGLQKAMEEQNRRFEEQFRELVELIINTLDLLFPRIVPQGNGAEIQLSLHQNIELSTFDRSGVISWIARAEQYFLVHNTPVGRRVQVALIALFGPAIAWIRILLRRSPLITWEDFARELQKRFETSSALNAYEVLCATTQEGSLDEFVAAIESRLA
ncbi:hypothetical protein AAHA92_06893 [Salvia divinorum]|uniref:Retrotransposon gag domain-containing protein n=1 Tax=Salvia divinorum TaxID=28513 RepID=A0ABD1I7X2_SALDI